MGLFARKQVVSVGNFCSNFYDKNILNPVIGDIDVNFSLTETIKKNITEADDRFKKIDVTKLNDEIQSLRTELFALAWTHKYINSIDIVEQSAFTKKYLNEKGRDDIWEGMKPYNDIIDSCTLDWMSNQGKANLSFNHNMREDFSAKNIEYAKTLKIGIDDCIERVNNRTWSGNAWEQRRILPFLAYTFGNQIGIDIRELNEEACFRLVSTIKGFYDGAKQSLDNIKIRN